MEAKLKVGDEVIIINSHNYKIDTNYRLSRSNMIHGNYKYASNAKIVGKERNCYIVNYINILDDIMQLGFLRQDIKLLKSSPKLIQIW